MSRTPLIAGNWKMHKTTLEAEEFVAAFLPKVQGLQGGDIPLSAPFPPLAPPRGFHTRLKAPDPRAERAPVGVGRLHRRDLDPDARRPRRARFGHRALRAPPILRRDQRGTRVQARRARGS